MRRSFLSALLLCAVLPFSLAAKPLRIAYVPKEADGPYWDIVHAGALKAVKDLAKQHVDIQLDWLPPGGKKDAAAQGDAVVSAAASRPDGLVVAPLDPVALKQQVEYAARNGTPVVVADTLLSSPLVSCYVGTNNYQAGQEAASLLGKLMHETGGVLIVGDYEKSANVAQREKGFVQGLNIGIQPLYSGDYAAAMPVVSSATAERWIRQFGSKIGGIFSADATAYAAVQAALSGGTARTSVVHMAFGNNPAMVAALKDGTLQALVADSPFEIGYQSIRAMSDVMAGKNVPARVSITTAVVTPDKLAAPDVQAFLNPPTLADIQNAPADATPAAGNAGDGKAAAPAAPSGQ